MKFKITVSYLTLLHRINFLALQSKYEHCSIFSKIDAELSQFGMSFLHRS